VSQTGRRRVATRAQREEVLRLVAEGTSRREAALRVFGDARLKGRVDRILRDHALDAARGALAPEELPSDLRQGSQDVPELEELFASYGRTLRRRLEDPDERVTASELLAFARLERWVENKRSLERINAITRDAPAPPARSKDGASSID
jgi:hypothetical protein